MWQKKPLTAIQKTGILLPVLTLHFSSVTVGQFPNLSDSVFSFMNWQPQNFSTSGLFRSHQKLVLLAYYYLGNEAPRGIVLTRCPRGSTYLNTLFGFCESQNDINISENTL